MRLNSDFFKENAVDLAPKLLGKTIVRRMENGSFERFIIVDVEAYCGESDLACHASKGRTKRTEVMYHEGGKVYVYLIYGMYWMLNFVCGKKNDPQAILIRGLKGISGPGRVGKTLMLNKSFYGENLSTSERLWLEDRQLKIPKINISKRIGIEYSGEIWSNKLYRFYVEL